MNVQSRPSNEPVEIFDRPQESRESERGQAEEFEASLAQALFGSVDSEIPEELVDRRSLEANAFDGSADPELEAAASQDSQEEVAQLRIGRSAIPIEISALPNARNESEAASATPTRTNPGAGVEWVNRSLREQGESASSASAPEPLAPDQAEQSATHASRPERGAPNSAQTSSASPVESDGVERIPRAGSAQTIAGAEPVRAASVIPQAVTAAGLEIKRQDDPRRSTTSDRSAANADVDSTPAPSRATATETRQERAIANPPHVQSGAERFFDDSTFAGERSIPNPELLSTSSAPLAGPEVDLQAGGIKNAPLNTPSTTEMARPQPVAAIPDQIGLLASRGGGTVRMRLHPGELGEVEIKVSIRGEVVDVTIRADEPAARAAVLHHRELLVEALGARELRMEGFDVSSGGRDHDAESRQAAWNGAEDRNRGQLPAAFGSRSRAVRNDLADSRQTGPNQSTRSEGLDLRI